MASVANSQYIKYSTCSICDGTASLQRSSNVYIQQYSVCWQRFSLPFVFVAQHYSRDFPICIGNEDSVLGHVALLRFFQN